MKSLINAWGTVTPWMKQIILFLAFSAGVILLLLWLAGKFEKKVSSEVEKPKVESKFDGQLARVRRITLPLTETAVGTVRSVHETSIGSKLLARVIEVNIKAGQNVKTGDILFRLDDTDLRARLQQAKAAVEAANATVLQAESDENRAKELLPARAISQQDYDKAMSFVRTAKAEGERASGALTEMQNMLDWATIRSPLDGNVIDKKVDVGDMVKPGDILATLYNPARMQLIASVRDSLARKLREEQEIGVQVEGIEHRCVGTISEIVPESQSDSRSSLVKVTGPCPPEIHPGLFGRIYIPVREERVLAVPKKAVRNIGQLELVTVVENGKASTRSIRTGRNGEENPELGNNVEVLSGLWEGEEVVVPSNEIPSQEANHD